jgi:tetratricopeptide (TPR) repeat protein
MTKQSTLSQLATRYHELTQILQNNKDVLPLEQVLDCLVSRDRITYVLIREGPPEAELVHLITTGDQRLKELAGSLSQIKEIEVWRDSLKPPSEAWWWHLSPPIPLPGFFDRFGWLWSSLALTCLILAVSLALDISSRFLSGGPDTWGAFVIIAQAALTLLTTRSVLTNAGQEAAKRMLSSLKFPRRFWEEAGATVALLLLGALLIFRLSLPQIAMLYNNSGLASYCAGQLSSAQHAYERALKLNPDYVEAHYNLGLLYEDLQDFDQTRAHYQIAVQGGLDLAYDRLAHLYILDKEYAAAVSFLLAGRQQVEQARVKSQPVRCRLASALTNQDPVKETSVEAVKYNLLKNLGWARLGQERYDEAISYLQEAISLAGDQAPAYCLRAQALEGQGDQAGAQVDWENCLKYASSSNADEDTWIGLARQRLGDNP